MAGQDRPLCGELERAASSVGGLDPSARSGSSKHLLDKLKGRLGLRLFAICADTALPGQGASRGHRNNIHLPVLANAAVVSVPPGKGGGLSEDIRTSGPDVKSTRCCWRTRSNYPHGGCPETPRGARNFESVYRCSEQRGCNPLASRLEHCIDFIESLFADGRALNTLNVARSMLPATDSNLEGVEVGKQPLIVELMSGDYNLGPPQPRYSHT